MTDPFEELTRRYNDLWVKGLVLDRLTARRSRQTTKGFDGMKIDRGVPVPDPAPERKKKYRKYPWEKMDDGDSVLVQRINAVSAREAARRWVKRNRPDLRVVSRKEPSGIRIWFVRRGDDQAV